MHPLINPVIKMPLFNGTGVSTGLSKPKTMADYLGKQTLQYGGAYFTYDPRRKDGAQFSPPWSHPKSSLLDARSTVSQLSSMEAENPIIYRHGSIAAKDSCSHSSPVHHAPTDERFTVYTKSPEIRSSTVAAPVEVKKQKNRGDNTSPQLEKPIYLAIPKPVYGHNPCCDEPGCVRGCYTVEHGFPGMPNTVYKHKWLHTDTHYSEAPSIHKRAPNTLMTHGGLQFEPSAERPKRLTMETYSPGRGRTLPPIIDANYSSYPCTLPHTLFGSLSEQNQQNSPRGYPGLYPSHHTYEHMTSDIYQEQSPMSKYGHLTQHPMFYYTQADAEVENRAQCKDTASKPRENIPVILQRAVSAPREHYMVPQSLHGEIPLPFACAETFPNHGLMQGFGYPRYAVHRFHLNASPSSLPLKKQHASGGLHSNHINVSPSSQNMDYPMASATSLHKDKLNHRLHVNQSHPKSAFLIVDKTSPTSHKSPPEVLSPGIQINRLLPPHSSLSVDRTGLATAGLSMDRVLDYSSCEAQIRCPKEAKYIPVLPGAQQPQLPHHSSEPINRVVHRNSDVRKIIHSPPVASGSKRSGPLSSSSFKGCLKRSISHSSSPIITKQEMDLFDVDLHKKRQKVEIENEPLRNKSHSPPMPVIDSVFSLAPYQTHLQATGVLFPGRAPLQLSERGELRTKPDNDERRKGQEDKKDAPGEEPVVEIVELKKIKVEKDASDTDYVRETPVQHQDDGSLMATNKEPQETCSFNSEPMLVIKKCDPDELESKPSLADKDETSDQSKSEEVTAQMNSSPPAEACTLHHQVVTFQPKSNTPPQPSEQRLNFENIPPHCLKLSNYNIILPDLKPSSPAPPPEKPCVQPTPEFIPKLLDQKMPVRKHFFEMHHSLHKLITKSVLASSEQKLRSWLSQLELSETVPSSTKVKKVSCLLGLKARELWLNKEIRSELIKLLKRLREYIAREHCPFPHVMRAGAVFLPMLVVKELLFPTVQGSYIDQVLQEHKVELRPTTLSEEKILFQLHKQACSSKLRKLMSFKHLPDIYADVVNLLYYTCVSKHLGKCMFGVTDVMEYVFSEGIPILVKWKTLAWFVWTFLRHSSLNHSDFTEPRHKTFCATCLYLTMLGV